MKINFKRVHLENFLSIGKADINLNDGGYTLVNGINQNPDDTAKSNGSGKSTIFEAIVWCLTGETMRGSKDVVNIHGTDGALVTLYFDIDEVSYEITRTKEHSKLKTNLKIMINGEDKSGKGIRDTEKLLSEYLPDLTPSLIGSVIILGQGLPQRFTNNTPAGRKEVLEKLSKSDFMLEDLKQRINNRKSTLSAALRKCEDDILQCNSKKSLLSSQISENEIRLDSLGSSDAIDSMISDLEGCVLDCNIKVNSFTEQIDELRNKYQEVANGKNAINEQVAESYKKQTDIQTVINNINKEYNGKIEEAKLKYAPTISSLDGDYIKASTELKSKQAELVKMQNIKDTCPTCGQKLPGVFKPDTTEIETAIESLKNSSDNALQAKRDTTKECEELVNKIRVECSEKIDAESSKLNGIETEINTFKSQLKGIDTELEKIAVEGKTAKASLEVYTTKCQGYKDRIESLRLDKESLEGKKQAALNIIEDNKKQIESVEIQIASLEKEKVSVSTHLDIINKMNTVITRDFRGYLLTNIIDFINKKAKEYSLDVFETDKIDFKIDGNNIAITYDGKDYQNLSGGEKQKVDVIVQFAIRDMLCKFLGFSSNILILDEICDNVDSVGAEKLFNMISNKLSDVQDVFIISHHSDFQLPCDRQLTVVKDYTKVSRVEYAI